jgi:hypothetical protein
MPGTIFDDAARAELCARAARLTAGSAPRWGRMTVGAMLAHVNDGLRMALGELPVRQRRTPLRFAPVRWLVLHALPFPRGAPTAPELLARCATATDETVAAELAAFAPLLDRVAARRGAGAWPAHPAFGPLSERDWGVLVHKHVDHHLRQFGC